MEAVKQEHSLSVDGCKKVTATGVSSVDAFSSARILLSYAGGRIYIEGSDLKVIGFSQTTGSFTATGNIVGVRYAERNAKFLQRLLK